MSMLNISNLGVRVGGKWALWDVTLEVTAGEIVAILGRSDAGKSTLARIVAGLEEPSSGTVATEGPVGYGRFRPALALDRPAYAPDLTVFENMDMFARLWGISRKRRVKEISFLLELMKLGDQRGVRADSLSSGALRRLEIARALVADSPLTIIDSLLDTLDSDIFEPLWDHILNLRREQMKSFLVMTSSGKVAEVCGRLAVLHKGRIGFVGRPDDFRRLAGEDMVVLGELSDPHVRSKIERQFSVVIREEEGFMSFKVASGERLVGDLLSEFGTDLGCVYLKRPTLEDALDVLSDGNFSVLADPTERNVT